jgi:hypothetical protein
MVLAASPFHAQRVWDSVSDKVDFLLTGGDTTVVQRIRVP